MKHDREWLRCEAILWNRLRHEQDGRPIVSMDEADEEELLARIEGYKVSEVESESEPNGWLAIEQQSDFDYRVDTPDCIEERIAGALVGRFAGCTLGVPVENFPIARMEQIAARSNTPFPPTEYWGDVDNPDGIQYGVNKRIDYARGHIKTVPVDDDITYTLLTQLELKEYGEDYTVEDVAELWKKVVPYGCTAEERALWNLQKGISGACAADDNPFVEWIGGAIRGDTFGYVCAGNPAKAARLAYEDARLTHRRNGIYGELFTAATIASSFVEKTPLDAVKRGAKFIPKQSRLAIDLAWALSYEGKLKDYRHARSLIDERFAGMDCVHTNNNMCAVVFAIMLGGGDYTQSIAQSIAIGLDNDCNGATVGSIVGANVGIDKIEKKWYEPFGDVVQTYLIGYETVSLKGMIGDYVALHQKIGGNKA